MQCFIAKINLRNYYIQLVLLQELHLALSTLQQDIQKLAGVTGPRNMLNIILIANRIVLFIQ